MQCELAKVNSSRIFSQYLRMLWKSSCKLSLVTEEHRALFSVSALVRARIFGAGRAYCIGSFFYLWQHTVLNAIKLNSKMHVKFPEVV